MAFLRYNIVLLWCYWVLVLYYLLYYFTIFVTVFTNYIISTIFFNYICTIYLPLIGVALRQGEESPPVVHGPRSPDFLVGAELAEDSDESQETPPDDVQQACRPVPLKV